MKCQICDSDIVFSIDITKRMGLCNMIHLKCIDSNWKYSLETSYQLSKLNSKNDRKFYDINIQSIIAFREIGKGLEGISSFCHSMNMSPPLVKKSYNRINDVLHQVYCEVASIYSMLDANEIHSLLKEGEDVVVDDEDVSLDGTWQKKGHCSKNGVVTAISASIGICLDYRAMLCQNHVRVAKHGQSDRMIQTMTNGKITTTAILILTIQNRQVPWKQLVQ